MNIIKFKDTVASGLDNPIDQNWYNKMLRGKYAYNIHCHYILPIEVVSKRKYVSFEKDLATMDEWLSRQFDYYQADLLQGVYVLLPLPTPEQRMMAVEYYPLPSTLHELYVKVPRAHVIDMDACEWLEDDEYIDWTGTQEANDVDKFLTYNTYIPDGDITMDDLRRFRTWVAESLFAFGFKYYQLTHEESAYHYEEVSSLSLSQMLSALEVKEIPMVADELSPALLKIRSSALVDFSDNDYIALNYYMNNMSDAATEILGSTSGLSVSAGASAVVPCGCAGSTNISSLYDLSALTCDSLAAYRADIKNIMVALLTQLEMWESLPTTYLQEMIKYLHGILTADFDLTSEDDDNVYGCECMKSNTAQEAARYILRQLIQTFEWIINNQADGHRTSIYNTLENWATNLYEHMQWV